MQCILNINRFFIYRVTWKTTLDTWISLGLHLDQSKYLGWVGKPSQHNSSSIKSSNTEHNLFSLVSSYVQAVLDINWILVVSTAHNSISSDSGYVEDLPRHLDSSWTASGAVQISGLGGEA